MKRGVYEAIATLVGTIIGAGVLGIPYVISKSGFLIGIFHIVVIGLAVLMVNLFLGEVVLRTKGDHQLTGYAEKYLGKFGKILISLTMMFGIYGALIAYLIGGSESLSAIFSGPVFYYFIGYFVVMSGLVFIGLKAIKKSEFILSGLILFIVLIISLVGFTKINFNNLVSVNFSYFFYPYGVMMFAFLGMAAIPEMKEELANNKKRLKKAIIIGSLIPLIVYILFAFIVVGVTGENTSKIATLGLSNVFGWQIVLFGNLFALFAVSTGFLALGLALKGMYNYDYKLN
ncbi:MAG: amino acid permease, partial [Nanoarchaeota archaeon]|nr:amino acid permease [Nanoarchaeota archaeon]